MGSITIWVILKFRRDGVRTEESGGNLEWPFGIQEQQRLQHAQLCFCLQSVTGFTFCGGGAMGEHFVQVRAGFFQ